jgi:hypothetical protein
VNYVILYINIVNILWPFQKLLTILETIQAQILYTTTTLTIDNYRLWVARLHPPLNIIPLARRGFLPCCSAGSS